MTHHRRASRFRKVGGGAAPTGAEAETAVMPTSPTRARSYAAPGAGLAEERAQDPANPKETLCRPALVSSPTRAAWSSVGKVAGKVAGKVGADLRRGERSSRPHFRPFAPIRAGTARVVYA